MADPKLKADKDLQSSTTTVQNSTTCDNSSVINPDSSTLSSKNDQQPSGNDATSKTLGEETKPQASTKKKNKKHKKKSDQTKGPSSNKESGEAASSINLERPPVPIYCKKCLGRNIGKKGERSDVYVITCSKCNAHEVLMKPDGNGVVKITDAGSENLPQGDLLDAVMKSAEDKIFSSLNLKDKEYPKAEEQISSRISLFAQRIQYCSRECADLYPLIITLRSLQLKKTSSTPQQRKTIENEIKSRLSSLEEGIQEIEAFAARFLKQSPGTFHSTATTTSAKKKKCPSAQSSASAGATSAEPKESTSQTNSSLFDPLSPMATSPTGAVCSPTADENTAVSSKVTGGASAAAVGVSNSSAMTSSKTKPSLWYIERVEQLNSRLEIMHAHLERYIMIQSVIIQNKAEEAIAKVQKNQVEGMLSFQNFTQGMVEHCKSTARDSCQKIEAKRKQIKENQKLLAEANRLAHYYRANGDEEGLRRIEEVLRQMRLQN